MARSEVMVEVKAELETDDWSVEGLIAALQAYVGKGASVRTYDPIWIYSERPETLAERDERLRHSRKAEDEAAFAKKWRQWRSEGLQVALEKARDLSPEEAQARVLERYQLANAKSSEEYIEIRERHLRERDARAKVVMVEAK